MSPTASHASSSSQSTQQGLGPLTASAYFHPRLNCRRAGHRRGLLGGSELSSSSSDCTSISEIGQAEVTWRRTTNERSEGMPSTSAPSYSNHPMKETSDSESDTEKLAEQRERLPTMERSELSTGVSDEHARVASPRDNVVGVEKETSSEGPKSPTHEGPDLKGEPSLEPTDGGTAGSSPVSISSDDVSARAQGTKTDSAVEDRQGKKAEDTTPQSLEPITASTSARPTLAPRTDYIKEETSTEESSDDDERAEPAPKRQKPRAPQPSVPKASPEVEQPRTPPASSPGESSGDEADEDKLRCEQSASDHLDDQLLHLLYHSPGLWRKVPKGKGAKTPAGRKPLPLEFESAEAYQAEFGRLVIAEGHAAVEAAWQDRKAEIRKEAKEEPDRPIIRMGLRGSTITPVGDGRWHYQGRDRSRSDGFEYLSLAGPGPTQQKPGQPPAEVEMDDLVLIQGDCSGVAWEAPPLHAAVVAYASREKDGLTSQRITVRSRTNLKDLPGGMYMRVWSLTSLVTLKRAFTALHGVPTLPPHLLTAILNPPRQPPPPPREFADLGAPGGKPDLQRWVQVGAINHSQAQALQAALNPKRVLTLIQGPPGTGKTTTITSLVSALLLRDSDMRILVCGPSNAAVDEVLRRLVSKGLVSATGQTVPLPPGQAVRLGPPQSIHPDCVPLRPEELLIRLEGAQYDRMRPGERFKAERDVLHNARIVFTTLSGSAMDRMEKQKFDMVIVDEAGQAVEVETLVPLQRLDLNWPRLVLVGDPHQLPATVLQHPSTAYERSLFERAMAGGSPIELLTVQYRMHPAIRSFPGKEFYHDKIQDAPSVLERPSVFGHPLQNDRPHSVHSSGLRFDVAPFRFLDVSWSTDWAAGNRSRLNGEEARAVVAVLAGLCKLLREEATVGVITPYREQQRAIRHRLRAAGLADRCEINTVDGFQGRELDVVVMSCVRADERFGIGFVSDIRRMNVALTRAQHCLLVVGNAATLEARSPTWKRLVEHARRTGAFDELSQCGKQPRYVQSSASSGENRRFRVAEGVLYVKKVYRVEALDNHSKRELKLLKRKTGELRQPIVFKCRDYSISQQVKEALEDEQTRRDEELRVFGEKQGPINALALKLTNGAA